MKFFLLILIFASASVVTQAQNTNSPLPPPRPSASPTPKLSELFAGNSANNQAVSRERREQAYAKLLEGQRFRGICCVPVRKPQSPPMSGRRNRLSGKPSNLTRL
jgi:hypothetical protein